MRLSLRAGHSRLRSFGLGPVRFRVPVFNPMFALTVNTTYGVGAMQQTQVNTVRRSQSTARRKHRSLGVPPSAILHTLAQTCAYQLTNPLE